MKRILLITGVALMMTTAAATQTLAAEQSPRGTVEVLDALVEVPQHVPLTPAFRALRFPTPVVQPSFRLKASSGRSFQSATPKRGWTWEHPVKFGALVGAGIGAVVGIIGLATYECPPGQVCSTAGVGLVFYPALGAGLGALLGLVAR